MDGSADEFGRLLLRVIEFANAWGDMQLRAEVAQVAQLAILEMPGGYLDDDLRCAARLGIRDLSETSPKTPL